MGSIFTIIGVLTNFWTLALILALAGISAAIYFVPFFGGPPKLIKFWLNPSTWIGIAGALALIYMSNATKTIEHQQQEIHQDKVQEKAQDDGVAVLTDNAVKKEKTKATGERLSHAITQAKPGDEVDAVLDQIAREQCSDPANHARPDCLH